MTRYPNWQRDRSERPSVAGSTPARVTDDVRQLVERADLKSAGSGFESQHRHFNRQPDGETTMAKGRKGWCEHYRGLHGHETCDAGVKYADVTDKSTTPHSLPCIEEWNRSGVTCEKCVYPTAEQVAERRAELDRRMNNIGATRKAIVESCGGPWKKGTPGTSGFIACPVCVQGQVQFSRAGYNGHIHARCSTENCVAWME